MAERKRLSGDEAGQYIGTARALLAQLKQSMQLNHIKVLQRAVDLPGGVRVIVSSIFGNDTITIQAPPDVEEAIARAAAAERQAQRPQDQQEVPVEVAITIDDAVYTSESCYASITRKRTVVSEGPLRIVIAGLNPQRDRPAIWSSDGGYGTLGLRNGEKITNSSAVAFISADGKWFLGNVGIYDSNINPATINPINGSGGVPYGYGDRAYLWKSGAGNNGNMVAAKSGDPGSYGMYIDSNGTVIGQRGQSRMEWDGLFNHAGRDVSGPIPKSPQGTTSPDGRVVVSGNQYRLDGGAWQTWGPSGASGYLVITVRGDPITSVVDDTTNLSFS